MNTIEKQMIELISADVFAVAEREAAHAKHARELIRKMSEELFPMNQEDA